MCHMTGRVCVVAGGCAYPGGHAWLGGHACPGACMPGGCVLGAMHGWGHAWLGGMCSHGACMPCPLQQPDTTRYGQSMSRRYTSYWNAFLFGPTHTELLAIALALAMQKMGRISIVNDASLTLTLSLRAQCEQALNVLNCRQPTCEVTCYIRDEWLRSKITASAHCKFPFIVIITWVTCKCLDCSKLKSALFGIIKLQ